MKKETIITTSGIVEMKNGKWEIIPDTNSDDIRRLNYTDRYPCDCAIIRHDSKYGLFYVSDMTSTFNGNVNPPLVSFDINDPFPYDEIVIKGVPIHEIMIIGYRIGNKWGIDNICYGIHERVLYRTCLASCNYPSLLDAESACLSWRNPFKVIMKKKSTET